jgi:hypothetical protein
MIESRLKIDTLYSEVMKMIESRQKSIHFTGMRRKWSNFGYKKLYTLQGSDENDRKLATKNRYTPTFWAIFWQDHLATLAASQAGTRRVLFFLNLRYNCVFANEQSTLWIVALENYQPPFDLILLRDSISRPGQVITPQGETISLHT